LLCEPAFGGTLLHRVDISQGVGTLLSEAIGERKIRAGKCYFTGVRDPPSPDGDVIQHPDIER
jgi:hypothetical protein